MQLGLQTRAHRRFESARDLDELLCVDLRLLTRDCAAEQEADDVVHAVNEFALLELAFLLAIKQLKNERHRRARVAEGQLQQAFVDRVLGPIGSRIATIALIANALDATKVCVDVRTLLHHGHDFCGGVAQPIGPRFELHEHFTAREVANLAHEKVTQEHRRARAHRTILRRAVDPTTLEVAPHFLIEEFLLGDRHFHEEVIAHEIKLSEREARGVETLEHAIGIFILDGDGNKREPLTRRMQKSVEDINTVALHQRFELLLKPTPRVIDFALIAVRIRIAIDQPLPHSTIGGARHELVTKMVLAPMVQQEVFVDLIGKIVVTKLVCDIAHRAKERGQGGQPLLSINDFEAHHVLARNKWQRGAHQGADEMLPLRVAGCDVVQVGPQSCPLLFAP